MKKTTGLFFLLVFCSLSLFFAATGMASGDLEWSVAKQLKLQESPLDVAPSADGKWLFVLAKGEVLVYSAPDDKLIKRIPVDKTFDRVASAPNNSLIVSSSAEKKVQLIQLELVHHFSLEGLPVEGPKNAPVTMVVFSDYQ